MLAHLAGQVRQHIVPLGYPHLERSISHAFNYSPIDGDHVFFRNDITSLL